MIRVHFRCTESFREKLKEKVDKLETDMSKYIRKIIEIYDDLKTGYLEYNSLFTALMKEVGDVVKSSKMDKLRELIQAYTNVDDLIILNEKLGVVD